MDITDIISSVEDIKDKTERCIAYADIIAYLRNLICNIEFKSTDCAWKDAIVTRMIKQDIDTLEECIDKIIGMIKFNIEN